DEALVRAEPGNRALAFELAQFSNNAADLLRSSGDVDGAQARSGRALELLEALVRPLPLLGIEHADASELRRRILPSRASAGALAACQQWRETFARLTSEGRAARLPRFHERFGDLLLNLNKLVQEHPADAGGHQLLMQALTFYFGLADRSLASGGVDVAGRVFD